MGWVLQGSNILKGVNGSKIQCVLGGFWALSDNLRLLHAAKGAVEGEMSVFVDSALPVQRTEEIEKALRDFSWVKHGALYCPFS